jgi:type IV pilus assembly protein PilV
MKKPSVLFLRSVSSGCHGSNQRGVALLEVLIAFFVLSIGLLGLAALQIRTVQFNQGSYQRSQATILAYDMLDRMRLNKTAASGNEYNLAWTNASQGTGTIAKKDLTAWLASISVLLPDGQGQIDCDSYRICDVSVRWTDRFAATAGTMEEITITSQIMQ